MKKTMLVAGAVVLVGVAAWTAYAYAQGVSPFGETGATCPREACAPTAKPCDPAAACGKDGAACHDDHKNCPAFKDENKDGKCDLAGKCQEAECAACPGHSEKGCAGHAEGGHVGHGQGGCGAQHGQGAGCQH